MILIALFGVFVATFLLAAVAVLVAWLVLERQQQNSAGAAAEPIPEGASLLKPEGLSSISLWDKLLARFDFVEPMKMRIAQAAVGWTVGRITAMMLLVGAVTFAVLEAAPWIPFWLEVVLASLASSVPYLYVLRRRRKRFYQFEEQLPEALDFLARALRAGHPFSVSLEFLANEGAQPLSGEMRITADENRLGLPLEQALRNLVRRVPLLNVRLFVAAVQLQSRTGGKLSEVLNQLAETMREVGAMRGEVRALAAHGRMTGTVLTVLPLGIAAIMMMVNPGHLQVLFEHPYGQHMIAGAIGALVAAHLIIRKIVDIRL